MEAQAFLILSAFLSLKRKDRSLQHLKGIQVPFWTMIVRIWRRIYLCMIRHLNLHLQILIVPFFQFPGSCLWLEAGATLREGSGLEVSPSCWENSHVFVFLFGWKWYFYWDLKDASVLPPLGMKCLLYPVSSVSFTQSLTGTVNGRNPAHVDR